MSLASPLSAATRFITLSSGSPHTAVWGFLNKAFQPVTFPVVTPGPPCNLVHSLLYHRPASVCRKDKNMMVYLIAVLLPRCPPWRTCGWRTAVPERLQRGRSGLRILRFPGCPAGSPGFASRKVEPQLALLGPESLFQGTAQYRGQAGGMPVKTNHATQCLEPERIGKPVRTSAVPYSSTMASIISELL